MPRHDSKGVCSSVFSLDTKFEHDNSLGVRVLANTNDFGSSSLGKENKLKVDKLMKDLESLSTKPSHHALFGFHQNNGKVEEPSPALAQETKMIRLMQQMSPAKEKPNCFFKSLFC